MLELIDARDHEVPLRIPRPRLQRGIEAEIRAIVEDVRLRGDAAVLEHAGRSTGVPVTTEQLLVAPGTIEAAHRRVPRSLTEALEVVAQKSRHAGELSLPPTWSNGPAHEIAGELIRPLRRVGVYAPAGSGESACQVMASIVAAQVAGVEGIAVCSSPDASGEVAGPVLAACAIAGVGEVYRIGGPPAVAALAYGTQTVRPVEKVVGRGDLRTVIAQREVNGWVGTGPEAGPAELVIVADDSVPARVVAADLVAHAAEGAHGTHALMTWEPAVLDEVVAQLDLEIAAQGAPEDVENALIEGGHGVLVRDLGHALEVANAFAPEYLELLVAHPEHALAGVRSAGAVLLGAYSPPAAESVEGSSLVLPTGGSARWSSGLTPRDFVKTIRVTRLDRETLGDIAPHMSALWEAEGSPDRARPIDLRLGR